MASIFPTGLTYSRNTKDPLQSNILWATLADASAYVNNPDETAYVGMTLAVTNDSVAKNNGLWYVEAIGTKDNRNAGKLKKVGSNEVLTEDSYSNALLVAKSAPVGTLINVTASEGKVEDENFHAAGFYIVSVTGENPSILLLSTTSGNDMDLDEVITSLTVLQQEVANKANSADVYNKTTADATFVKDVQGQNVSIDRATGIVTVDMSGKVDSTDYDQFVQTTNAALDSKLEASDLDEYAKTADVVANSTYNNDKKAIDDAIEALNTEVGNKAEGETPASGIYKIIDDVAAALREDITEIPKFDILPVNELPAEGISESTVYLVKNTDSETQNLYTEYIYVNGAWENLGKQTVDLSGYSTTTEMNQAISDAIEAKIAGYYTKEEVDGFLNGKADATDLENYVLTSKLESDYLTKALIEAELGKKANATELSKYVENGTFNTELSKKADVTMLDSYVDNTSYGNDKTALEAAIAKKADESVLEDYLKIADIDANLTAYVKKDSLNTQLSNYVLSTDLETKLNDYVLVSAFNTSTSITPTADGVYEVNVISDKELQGIINGEVIE